MVFAAKSHDIFDVIDVIHNCNGYGMSFAVVPSSDAFAKMIMDWSKYASEPHMPCELNDLGLTIRPRAHTPAEVKEEATRLPPPAQRQHGDASLPHVAFALPADVQWLTTRWPDLLAAMSSVFTKTDRQRGYREPPELAEGGNKGSSGTEGNHRKTGREAERPPRSSSRGQPGPKASNQQPNHCSKA